ncbi:DUF922 domain-containing protein [Niabella ginsengisoli]|uniref:DUF922 domain-containing protein n=1 Tax=Niabella ginsengisoli TaxID=522298 RepID=A0ABS9SHP7_9BACT|nr:DUF922 domain-containing protein [Niabella ginsengisoli]MCH5597881.1 DUF922 domain-containing protein [Niabella ginsengisoli]
MRILIIAWILLTLVSCSSKLSIQAISKQPALSDSDFVLVLRQSDDFVNDGVKVGSIKSVDNGFSINCTYNEVIENLKILARKNGANLIKITKRLPPDSKSTCEKIYADIYRVPDLKKHELEIEWNENRKLTWEDFKGSPATVSAKVWFGAASQCDIYLESNAFGLFSKPKFYTSAKFTTFLSWVKPSQKSDSLLAHEQCHFDIVELYRRKLQKQLDSSNLNFSNAQERAKEMTRQISKQYHNEQAVYDEETRHGSNRIKQKEWEARIAQHLKTERILYEKPL